MKFDELKEKWDNMPAVGNGFLKLGIEHPLVIRKVLIKALSLWIQE